MATTNLAYAGVRQQTAPTLTALAMPRALSACGVHRVELISDFSAAEPHWRALEANGVYSPYQRFAWMEAWQRHAGAAEGISPLLLTGFDRAGEPLFLLPLGYVPEERCKIVRFLGGKHANYNFGPFRRDFSCGTAALRSLIDWMYAVRPELDGVELLNQPENWDGMQNPFHALPHQQSPSDGHWLSLDGKAEDVTARVFTASRRKRLRYRERKLQDLGASRYVRAKTEAEVDRYLNAFFEQKAERLARQGFPNVFAEPGIKEFARDLCVKNLAEDRPAVEIHALDTDGEVLAVFACVNDPARYASMFNSITLGPASRFSPGVVLIAHILKDCIERGIKGFDLGVGDAEYKTYFCNRRETLFDSYFGLSTRGQAYVAALSAGAAIKRWVKRSPALMKLALAARRLKAEKNDSGSEPV